LRKHFYRIPEQGGSIEWDVLLKLSAIDAKSSIELTSEK
jgi:hypothetical protein